MIDRAYLRRLWRVLRDPAGQPSHWPDGLYERLTRLGREATETTMFIECAKECMRIATRAYNVYYSDRYWGLLDAAHDTMDRVVASVNPKDAAVRLGYVVAYVLSAMCYYMHPATRIDRRFDKVRTMDEVAKWLDNAIDELERSLVSGVYDRSVNVCTITLTK